MFCYCVQEPTRYTIRTKGIVAPCPDYALQNQHVIIPYDTWEPLKRLYKHLYWSEITITFDPNKVGVTTPNEILQKKMKHIYRYVESKKYDTLLYLVPELHTGGTRAYYIHYHGIVIAKDRHECLNVVQYINNKYGRTQEDEILDSKLSYKRGKARNFSNTNPNGTFHQGTLKQWIEYIHKDLAKHPPKYYKILSNIRLLDSKCEASLAPIGAELFEEKLVEDPNITKLKQQIYKNKMSQEEEIEYLRMITNTPPKIIDMQTLHIHCNTKVQRKKYGGKYRLFFETF